MATEAPLETTALQTEPRAIQLAGSPDSGMAFSSSSMSALIPNKRNSSGQGPSPGASLLIEKTKAGVRRSTPDSEALASSDDEQDHNQRHGQAALPYLQRPIRRTSWRNEHHMASQRKSSLGGNEALNHTPSHGTLIMDSSTWAAPTTGIARTTAANNPFNWGSTIWKEPAKGPPSRLAEVLPSSSTHEPPPLMEDTLSSPTARRDSAADAAIPFAIPLHPTLKTYRSQSYSVGQLDQEWSSTNPRHGQLGPPARARGGPPFSGLQHRLSKPSILGDFSPDTSVLEQLREVDDDGETSTEGSEIGARAPGQHARTIEQLAMENAILRQQAYGTNLPLASGAAAATPAPYLAQTNPLHRLPARTRQVNESVLEEPDDTSVATDDIAMGHGSHHGASTHVENRALESLKKGHWQSSLGFGSMDDSPQSRRHSFADVPLRSTSGNVVSELRKTSIGDSTGALAYVEGPTRQSLSESTSYFSNALPRHPEIFRPPSSSSAQGFAASHQAQKVPSSQSLSTPRGQLYVVTFKAARAEFYYVQEGTGLEVNAGDLVIVEADRGTDLGTVAHKNVDWTSARQLRERYATEHYNWLMMFSRQGQGGRPNSSTSPTTVTTSTRSLGSNAPGTTALGSSGSIEATGIEIKPKMIKRLAQPHEIHTLRDKEGNEAKAKRMCQQKVAEHHLSMEILDAEFQMDWKKLTFYYYAEAYVNFNSLVTDLFKIYKTRIWMSAINPASFVSPLSNLPFVPASAANVPQSEHDRPMEARSRPDGRPFGAVPFQEPNPEAFDNPWADKRIHPPTTYALPPAYAQYFHQAPSFSSPSTSLDGFSRGMQQNIRTSSPLAFPNLGSSELYQDTAHMNPHYRSNVDQRIYAEQLNAFEGLSLES